MGICSHNGGNKCIKPSDKPIQQGYRTGGNYMYQIFDEEIKKEEEFYE